MRKRLLLIQIERNFGEARKRWVQPAGQSRHRTSTPVYQESLKCAAVFPPCFLGSEEKNVESPAVWWLNLCWFPSRADGNESFLQTLLRLCTQTCRWFCIVLEDFVRTLCQSRDCFGPSIVAQILLWENQHLKFSVFPWKTCLSGATSLNIVCRRAREWQTLQFLCLHFCNLKSNWSQKQS